MSKVNIVWDASMLDMFQLCACRFNYRYNLNKEQANKPHQLDRGSVMHAGLETYYKSLAEGKRYQDAVDVALLKAKVALAESTLDVVENRQILTTLEENVEYWRIEDQNNHIEDVEKSFIYLLHEDDNVKIYMIGKIDLLVSNTKYTNLPIDHKTHDREREVRKLSNQFINYCNGTKSHYLVVNKIGFQKTLKPEERFKRVPVSYDPLIIEEWKQNVIGWAYQYLHNVVDNRWPMNMTSCDKFFRKCEYLEICESSGIEAKLWKLDAMYNTTEPWDVSKSLAKKE